MFKMPPGQAHTYILPQEHPPCSLSRLLTMNGISARSRSRLKRTARFFLPDREINFNILLQPGASVTVISPPLLTGPEPAPAPLPLTILYEDDFLLLINKPSGMLTHPADGERQNSLANHLAAYYRQTGQYCVIHPVFRLDRNTSGLVIFAKDATTQHLLSREKITKEYLALLQSPLPEQTGSISAPIARKDGSIIERVIDWQAGKPAHTDYEILARYPHGQTLAKFILRSGRTHQIRVHAAYLQAPLVHDGLYGPAGPPARHALHCWRLTFLHPHTGRLLRYSLPLPEDLLALIRAAQKS